MKKIDKFHRHEVLDRCMMLCDILEDSIMSHPALTTCMAKDLAKAQGLIYNVACKAADDHCKKCGKTAMTIFIVKGKKKAGCLNCFHTQKRK